MELLELKDFERAYPFLVKKINEIRGGSLIKEYSPNTKIPIEMQDAAFVDSYLEHLNPKKNILGFNKSKKILKVIESYPNMDNWLKILYPIAEKKKKIKQKANILDETVVWPKIDKKDNYYCVDSNNKKYFCDCIPLERMERAFKKNKIIRLRRLDNGKYKCRIMKPETFGETFETDC